ncbi:MAG: L-2-hydroxyglutarate oxidase [Solirubrobacterales bacterium]|nr:L-2-hydroxyglutarate oxidase [Solirubrobacterales bacterium]
MDDVAPARTDICVVGGGIVGVAAGRELQRRHPDATVTILEREHELAVHQSGHSSGVIHAGIYYAPGSLKARLCVEGARRLYEYCEERGLDARRDGKVIVATRESELSRLGELEGRGIANGVPGLRRIEPAELREIEPHANGVAALHSPATGVVDYRAVTKALAEDFVAAGGRVVTGCEVRAMTPGTRSVMLAHSRGRTEAGNVVLCAGPWADRLAVAAGADPDPRVVPFRGAYLRLRPERSGLVGANIYPVPDPDLPFLGMHLTRDPHGNVLLGPTALFVGARDAYRLRRVVPRDLLESLTWPGTRRMMRRFWRNGIVELRHAISIRSFVAECRRYVPELRREDVERSHHSGVRAQAIARDGSLVDDFVVSETEHAVHVRNAPSPAATSSLALAELIADRLERVSETTPPG